MTPVLVLTTVGASFDVAPLARALVEGRLAACVNVVEGIRSIYRWKETIEDEAEKLLVIKTVEEQLDDLERALQEIHPYEVPEFVVVPISRIAGPYRNWLIESVSPR